MKRTGARETDAKRPKDASKKEGQEAPLNLSIEQIEDRAFTKTEVLVGILQQQEGPYLRHWGLNE